MRIHQFSCGEMFPWGGRFVDGFSHGIAAKLVCHCWLIDTPDGLVLIDTGLGHENHLHPIFKKLLRPRQSMHQTALSQVLRLGFQAHDVKHIILTNMEFDHAGGLCDFPQAEIHVWEDERLASLNRNGWLSRSRYRPKQWRSVRQWQAYRPGPENWFGFAATRLRGISAKIWLVSLPGHSRGQAGVAVETDDGWMLHAGDAYFYRREVEPVRHSCTLGLWLYQRLTDVNHRERMDTQRRLREIVRARSSEVRMCSTHDFIELTAYQASAEPIRRLQRQALNRLNATVTAQPDAQTEL